MYDLYRIVNGGEYELIVTTKYHTAEWLHFFLWNWFKISTFIKEV